MHMLVNQSVRDLVLEILTETKNHFLICHLLCLLHPTIINIAKWGGFSGEVRPSLVTTPTMILSISGLNHKLFLLYRGFKETQTTHALEDFYRAKLTIIFIYRSINSVK